jgi:hypothetical protein
MSTTAPLCRHCRKPESDHHEFEPWVAPEGCVCDPGTWTTTNGTIVTPICSEYKQYGDGYCITCGHDRECHK